MTAEKKMCEMNGYGLPEGTEEEKKKKANTEYGKACDRLIAIPSELEVSLFLHDLGKILVHYGKDFEVWMNRDNGADIVFSDGEYPPGKTDMAFIDVKNVDLKDDGTNYTNLIIEVSKRYDGEWHHELSWGYHYTDGSTNRYIAYVRDGKKYGGKLATETDVFGLDKTEEENAHDIIDYFSENRNLLNHDIYFVRGIDISKSIAEKSVEYRKADEKRRRKLVTEKGGKMMYFEQLPIWKKKYPLMEVSRTAEGWMVKHTGNGAFEINTKIAQKDISPTNNATAEEVEKGMIALFERLRNRQSGELTTDELLRTHGVDMPLLWEESTQEEQD